MRKCAIILVLVAILLIFEKAGYTSKNSRDKTAAEDILENGMMG